MDIILSTRGRSAEGGVMQRCRTCFPHLTAAAPSFSPESLLLQLFLLRPVQAAVGCWQPTSVQNTVIKAINPVFPIKKKIKLNISSGKFSSATLHFNRPYL